MLEVQLLIEQMVIDEVLQNRRKSQPFSIYLNS